MQSWRDRGYVERLRDRFRLVLIDSRGHGESDKPDDQESYELRGRVLDIGAVLRAEEIDAAHFFGYSMGGWIGYGVATYMPQRFRSLVIGGFGPVTDPYFGITPEQLAARSAQRRADAGSPLSDAEQTRICNIFAETARFGGAEQAMKTTRLPVLLFSGTDDPRHDSIRDAEALTDRASFFALPGKDHGGGLADSVDEVVPRVIQFLEGVEAS